MRSRGAGGRHQDTAAGDGQGSAGPGLESHCVRARGISQGQTQDTAIAVESHDGTTREVSYAAGETRYFHFGPGEYLLHDIENVGDTELIFTTVEHLDGDNAPLELS